MKYPIGIQSFEKLIEGGYTYVDKTALVYDLVKTGTPSYLIRLLSHSNEQMDEITGQYYKAAMFIDYKADVEKPLPMIYQSGYLAIKDFDMETESYLLDFPNNEVREGFAADALRQIDNKGYARPYATDRRQIRRIGVSFSSKTRIIEEWEEY